MTLRVLFLSMLAALLPLLVSADDLPTPERGPGGWFRSRLARGRPAAPR